MLLSWVKAANPSSQDRTPRCAIGSAVSPAAASYRASGLVLWHNAEVPGCPLSRRYQGHSGRQNGVPDYEYTQSSLCTASQAGQSHSRAGLSTEAVRDAAAVRANTALLIPSVWPREDGERFDDVIGADQGLGPRFGLSDHSGPPVSEEDPPISVV
jgi:hypothetical protein